MNTSSLLSLDDRCHRAGWRAIRQSAGPRGAWAILREAIETGLEAYDYRPERAASAVRNAALNSQLEVEPANAVYQISEHLAAIAEQVVYVVGGDRRWTRPEPILLDEGLWWESGVFLDADGSNLRRVVLTDYWGDSRMVGEGMSWHEAGEQAIYGGTLTEVIVLLGAHRENRFHGLWSKGWKHPQNSDIRLQSVSGGEFKRYRPFWREDEKIPVHRWAQLMPTGLALTVMQREPLDGPQRKAWKALALRKLEAMQAAKEPLPQLSQCWKPSQCPFGPCQP
jgi:hypothetical protein